jgi:hypothetical protein
LRVPEHDRQENRRHTIAVSARESGGIDAEALSRIVASIDISDDNDNNATEDDECMFFVLLKL